MSQSRVVAVLWDADGVLQVGPAGWDDAFGAVLGDRAEEIGTEIFTPLDEALVGRLDMAAHVRRVLAGHGLEERETQILDVWRRLEPVPETRALVTSLAIPSYLATNQDDWRATCMRSQLGYDELLAGSFYSCEVGSAKPHVAFFGHIGRELGLRPGQMLFIDDRTENVEGAERAGLSAVLWHFDQGIDVLLKALASHGVEAS